jgi:thioredoxin 1
MARPPQNPGGGTPSPESSRPARNLYLIELLLGGGLVVLVVAIFFANDGTKDRGSGQTPGKESANVVTLTAENWQHEVLESPVPVVVDFWAPWCPPCVRLSPIVEEVAEKYAGKVKVGKLNIDDSQEVAQRYVGKAIPQVSIFNGGATPQLTLVGEQAFGTNIAKAIDSILK